MSEPAVEEAFSVFERYLDVNDSRGLDALRQVVESVRGKTIEEQGWTLAFRQGLARILAERTLTVDRFETMTGRAFDDQDDLFEYLTEVWREVFGEEPPGTASSRPGDPDLPD